MSNTTFVLMNLDLAAVALPGDAAQDGLVDGLYSGQLSGAAPGCHGRQVGPKNWGQQIDNRDATAGGARDSAATISGSLSLFDPLVDGLHRNAATFGCDRRYANHVGGSLDC
jgi:hypothetical protein